MKIIYKRPFAQFIKKANKPLQFAIEDQILEICRAPDIGEQKTGDLREIRVYKFRFNKQEYLLAYKLGKSEDEINLIYISFYQVGSHENFYNQLKRYIQQEPEVDKAQGGKK
jgi:hypothetical protein